MLFFTNMRLMRKAFYDFFFWFYVTITLNPAKKTLSSDFIIYLSRSKSLNPEKIRIPPNNGVIRPGNPRYVYTIFPLNQEVSNSLLTRRPLCTRSRLCRIRAISETKHIIDSSKFNGDVCESFVEIK